MNLHEYFNDNDGMGIFSTANGKGEVNSAVYAKPHFLGNGNLAFIMRDRLTHHNLRENPYANFLFVEHDRGFRGIRLYLQKVGETDDPDIIETLSRRQKQDINEKRFLVSFQVTKALQLIGGELVEINQITP